MSHAEEAQKKRLADENSRTQKAIAEILRTPSGRQLYRWIEDASEVWLAAPADGQDRAAWIGRRALGLFILGCFRQVDLDACLKADRERRDLDAAFDAAMDDARHLDEEEARKKAKFSLDNFLSEINPQTSNPAN